MNDAATRMGVPPLPPGLASSNPARWLTVFGPGAVVASLTIGAGELIFSSRAGALFGYRLLWFFLVVLVFKWVLVYGAARHMVLTGAHPFQRWVELPGLRGWLPCVFLVLGVLCFPIWVGFHAGTVGTLVAELTGTAGGWGGVAHLGWGVVVLAGVMGVVFAGGYTALERIQLVIVLLMLGGTVVSVFLLRPDWWELLRGLLVPGGVAYPEWARGRGEFAGRPVWVEAVTYVGVLGGSGYDYLAYVSYLREKGWGRAGGEVATRQELDLMAGCPGCPERRWLRAVAVDSVLSFVAVLVFTGVFVACGAMVLGPAERVPGGTHLLALQADFFSPLHPWLRPLYFAGAFLAMVGTLYGTIEVAPVVLREAMAVLLPGREGSGWRRMAVGWAGGGGMVVLLAGCVGVWAGGGERVPGLVALLTPANLFTGVMACGIICGLGEWAERRHLPSGLRGGWLLRGLNVLAGIAFLGLGVRGYWDHSGWTAFLLLAGTVGAGWGLAYGMSRWSGGWAGRGGGRVGRN